MPRRKKVLDKSYTPDPNYNSPLVSHLVNKVMVSGKKSLACRIVYGSLSLMSEKLEKGDVVDLLLGCMSNIRPKLEVKSRRVGGATYQVPVEISRHRQDGLALRWLVTAARSRKGVSMQKALADELIDAYNNTGAVVRKKEETHKMAQANRAFAHFAYTR